MDVIIEVADLPGRPTYARLAEGIRQAILAGRFQPGERLPATRVIAAALGVARNTVLEAYDSLAAEGYLVARHGSGTFVAPELPERALRATPGPTAVAGAAVDASSLSRFGRRVAKLEQIPGAWTTRLPYDFRYGTPSLEEFPMAEWRALTRRVLDYPPSVLLGYGPAEGLPALREALARYLQRARGVRCTADEVVVVNGSQQALDLAARVLVDPGDVVAMEEPGYTGARAVFEMAGATVVPVPVDGEGLVVDQLPANARVVYVTPSHQFPTGVVLSAARRLQLLEWASRAGATIIEDDYDSEFRYSGRPLTALQGLDATGHVVYTATMSKVLLPSLRMGYLVPPAGLRPAFANAKWLTDRHSALLYQAVLAAFIEEGHFERHLRRMRRVYARRLACLLEALDRHLGGRVSVDGAESGMHVMLTIHDVADGDVIVEGARAVGVGLHPAAPYYAAEPPYRATFVVGYSSLTETEIAEGIARLARVVRAYDRITKG